MLEPVDVAIDKNGRVFIGKIEYKDGEPVSSKPVEMTSQGAHVNGLDARKIISAAYACHIYGGKERAFIKAVYDKRDDVSAPVSNITTGLTVGFRYLQFGSNTPESVTVYLNKVSQDFTLNVKIDDYKGKVIATGSVKACETEIIIPLKDGVIGKHAVYFEFKASSDKPICEFDKFTFD